MRKYISTFAAMSLVTFLFGCGGSATGPVTMDAVQNPPSFSEVLVSSTSLISALNGAPAATMSAVPASGSASFLGSSLYGNRADATDISSMPLFASDFQVDVDFASGSVTGSFTNFSAPDGTVVVGQLDLGNGRIQGGAIAAEITGNISVDGERGATSGLVAGAFVEADASAVAGAIGATRVTSSGSEDLFAVFGGRK